MEKIKILKEYNDEVGKWYEETISDFLDRTEGSGYWKKGTAMDVLKQNGYIRTPFATYKIEESNNCGHP